MWMSNKYPLTSHSHTPKKKGFKLHTHYNKMFKCESPVSSAKIQVIQNQDWNLRPSPWLCWSLSRAESEILENQQLWSFEELSTSTNINQDDNWCYECCCSSTDLLASFFLRRQTCGGRFFLRTIWTSPDVTSLTSPDVTSFLRKIFTAWFLCAPIIPGVFDPPSFIRILRGFHFQVHLQVFMSFKPEYSSSCPYFALDSWLLSIRILVDAFKAVDDSE